MKLTKKAVIGFGLLALLGGGLAGCGKKTATQSGQQKAESASNNQANVYQHRQQMANDGKDTLEKASSAFRQSSPLEKKYSGDITIIPGNVTLNGKSYESLTFNLYKLPKGVKPDSMNQDGPSNNARSDKAKDYNYKLPYKDVLKAFWKDTTRGIQKKGLQKNHPGVFVYRYIDGNPDDTATHQSAIFYGLTNSPKLHVAQKNQFKSQGTGSY